MIKRLMLAGVLSLVALGVFAAVQEVPFHWKFERDVFQDSKDYTMIVTVDPAGKVFQNKKQVATVPAGFRIMERRILNPGEIRDGAVIDELLTTDTYTFKLHLSKNLMESVTLRVELNLLVGNDPPTPVPCPRPLFPGIANGENRRCRYNETFSINCQGSPNTTAMKIKVLNPAGKVVMAERVHYTASYLVGFQPEWVRNLQGLYRFVIQVADNTLYWSTPLELGVNVNYQYTLVRQQCHACNGSGWRYVQGPCFNCDGRGYFHNGHHSYPCNRCRGSGRIERREPCYPCNGRGYVEESI